MIEKLRQDKADQKAKEDARQAEVDRDNQAETTYLAKTKVIVKEAREAREQPGVSDAMRAVIDLTIDGLGNCLQLSV